MLSIVNVFILTAVLVIAAIFIYKLIYTYQINRKIQLGEGKGRKLMDFHKMVTVAVIVGLVVYSTLLMYIIHDYANADHTVSRNNYAVIDVSNPDQYTYASYFGNQELEDASFAKVYSKDANEGYSKEVTESGEYVFTVFKRTAPADSFHPDFLCFVEYTGTGGEQYELYTKSGFRLNGEEGFSVGNGGEAMDCLLYIGYLEPDCAFHISMSLLDEQAAENYDRAMQKAYEDDKGIFPEMEEYAVTTGSVDIEIGE